MYRQVQLQIHVDLASAVGPVSECQLTKRFTPTTEFKARPDSQVWYIIGRPMSIALWRSFNTSLEEFLHVFGGVLAHHSESWTFGATSFFVLVKFFRFSS